MDTSNCGYRGNATATRGFPRCQDPFDFMPMLPWRDGNFATHQGRECTQPQLVPIGTMFKCPLKGKVGNAGFLEWPLHRDEVRVTILSGSVG